MWISMFLYGPNFFILMPGFVIPARALGECGFERVRQVMPES